MEGKVMKNIADIRTGKINPEPITKEQISKMSFPPDYFCIDCMQDELIPTPRNPDVICLIYGTKLCGYHILAHLKEKHCIDIHL